MINTGVIIDVPMKISMSVVNLVSVQQPFFLNPVVQRPFFLFEDVCFCEPTKLSNCPFIPMEQSSIFSSRTMFFSSSDKELHWSVIGMLRVRVCLLLLSYVESLLQIITRR